MKKYKRTNRLGRFLRPDGLPSSAPPESLTSFQCYEIFVFVRVGETFSRNGLARFCDIVTIPCERHPCFRNVSFLWQHLELQRRSALDGKGRDTCSTTPEELQRTPCTRYPLPSTDVAKGQAIQPSLYHWSGLAVPLVLGETTNSLRIIKEDAFYAPPSSY